MHACFVFWSLLEPLVSPSVSRDLLERFFVLSLQGKPPQLVSLTSSLRFFKTNSFNFPSSGSMKQTSHSFKPDEKPKFLARFQQNKKDLSWTKEFVAEERTEDNSTTSTLGGLGFFNRNEIQRMRFRSP